MSASSPTPQPHPSPDSVLRIQGIVPFMLARVLALLAVQIQAVEVAWQIYDITREAISLAYGRAGAVDSDAYFASANGWFDRPL